MQSNHQTNRPSGTVNAFIGLVSSVSLNLVSTYILWNIWPYPLATAIILATIVYFFIFLAKKQDRASATVLVNFVAFVFVNIASALFLQNILYNSFSPPVVLAVFVLSIVGIAISYYRKEHSSSPITKFLPESTSPNDPHSSSKTPSHIPSKQKRNFLSGSYSPDTQQKGKHIIKDWFAKLMQERAVQRQRNKLENERKWQQEFQTEFTEAKWKLKMQYESDKRERERKWQQERTEAEWKLRTQYQFDSSAHQNMWQRPFAKLWQEHKIQRELDGLERKHKLKRFFIIEPWQRFRMRLDLDALEGKYKRRKWRHDKFHW